MGAFIEKVRFAHNGQITEIPEMITEILERVDTLYEQFDVDSSEIPQYGEWKLFCSPSDPTNWTITYETYVDLEENDPTSD